MVEDRMVGSIGKTSREQPAEPKCEAAVRVLVIAEKLGNASGAKEHRKVNKR